jgi:hypothetical protein
MYYDHDVITILIYFLLPAPILERVKSYLVSLRDGFGSTSATSPGFSRSTPCETTPHTIR